MFAFLQELGEGPRQIAQIVDTHRELWIELSRLVRQTGYAMTYTYGFYILYMFLSLTFFVYHTVSNLARQLRADQVLMAIECCVMEYTLYLICSAANNASRNVSLSSLFFTTTIVSMFGISNFNSSEKSS